MSALRAAPSPRDVELNDLIAGDARGHGRCRNHRRVPGRVSAGSPRNFELVRPMVLRRYPDCVLVHSAPVHLYADWLATVHRYTRLLDDLGTGIV